MKRRTLLQGLGAVATLPATFSIVRAQSLDGAKPTVIRIGFPGAGTGGRPSVGGSFPASADALGEINQEFQPDGIRVEWKYYAGAGPALNEAYANGLLDICFGHGDLPLVVGRSTGLKHKIVLSSSRLSTGYFIVPAGSQAQSIADLKGKRIATFKGTAAQTQLIRFLRRDGFEEKDFRVISLNSDDIKAALATGDIDGTAGVVQPFDLEARGIARTLLKSADPAISTPGTVWVGEAFEQQYPAVVQRVVSRLVKVAHWGSQEANRERQFNLWARAGNDPFANYKTDWTPVKDLRTRVNPLLDEYYHAALTRAIGEIKEFKLIRRDVSLDGWVEPRYLQQALREQQLEHYWPEFDAQGRPKAAAAS